VPIEPGTYRVPRSAWSVVDFTVTFPGGWMVQGGHNYLKHSDTVEELFFQAVVIDEIYADACQGNDGDIAKVGPTADDLAAALLAQRGTKASGPIETTLGGYPAVRIDLTTPNSKACPSMGLQSAVQIWHNSPTDDYFVLHADGFASVYILDVDGERQVFLTQYRSAASEEDVRQLQEVIDSIHIGT
jgi:hypothetical protein